MHDAEDRVAYYLGRLGYKEGDDVPDYERGFALAFVVLERRRKEKEKAAKDDKCEQESPGYLSLRDSNRLFNALVDKSDEIARRGTPRDDRKGTA